MSKAIKSKNLKRVIFKIGSSSIVDEHGQVRLGFLGNLVRIISELRNQGTDCVLVSSGAIALGYNLLGLVKRPTDIPSKQASASVGQSHLMSLYQTLFGTLGVQTSQILLTRDDLEDRRRYLNAREAFEKLLSLGLIPIVNENDTVSVEEIQFGDNDFLSALVAGLVDADLLILLTDVDGLYTSDPKKDEKASVIDEIGEEIEQLECQAGDSTTDCGTGGMISKLDAAKLCRQYGIPCIIAKGKGKVLRQILSGKKQGTYVTPQDHRLSGRQRWLAKAALIQGTIIIDKGASKAITKKGKSLLPPGIQSSEGEFLRGAVVRIEDETGEKIGRGVIRYRSKDLAKIIGKKGSEIESILGYTFGDEIIHHDDLVKTI